MMPGKTILATTSEKAALLIAAEHAETGKELFLCLCILSKRTNAGYVQYEGPAGGYWMVIHMMLERKVSSQSIANLARKPPSQRIDRGEEN